ncbi:hypothetical protein VB711_01180 [Cronbergia sp. UHCC 0137]|uniref:hypothetical protein n=1 Tax=Cronbergia sp. UHCC 0137 TaxID=3110239 RepID=UPI002B1FF5B2|nr:hypothetical protein [Cronbergia sp. UHCC 0137]MEA5616457.1 hypothetical protein [Cronbergia sp. UHCC 0137]
MNGHSPVQESGKKLALSIGFNLDSVPHQSVKYLVFSLHLLIKSVIFQKNLFIYVNTMQTITLNSHIGQDGILHLDIPVDVTNTDLTITVILKPVNNSQHQALPKGKGWPANFFEETSGCLKDTPLTVDSEGVYNDLEEFELL